MSLGPSDADRADKPTTEVVQKIQVFTRGAVKVFLTRPSYVLFYLGVAAAMVGLYVGKNPPLIYYAILAMLGLIELVLWNTAQPRKPKPSDPALDDIV